MHSMMHKDVLYAESRDQDSSGVKIGSFFFSLHNAIRPRGHSRHVALSSNPSMLIDKSKR